MAVSGRRKFLLALYRVCSALVVAYVIVPALQKVFAGAIVAVAAFVIVRTAFFK